jgi:hypothetical protein
VTKNIQAGHTLLSSQPHPHSLFNLPDKTKKPAQAVEKEANGWTCDILEHTELSDHMMILI